MMINTSKFSKSLTIFLLYNIIKILIVTCNHTLATLEDGNGESNASPKGDPETTTNEDTIVSKQQDISIEGRHTEIQDCNELMNSIQLGIGETVKDFISLNGNIILAPSDFISCSQNKFLSWSDSNEPSAPRHKEFDFIAYSPRAFYYFRQLFGISEVDYFKSFYSMPLNELSNPGASGSKLYLTNNDRFIMKSLQATEGTFFRLILPYYKEYMKENPTSMLPKCSGLYGYVCGSKKLELITMENLLPSKIKMHVKYDLKGSTFNRLASSSERLKRSPTFKDNDFMSGFYLMKDTLSVVLQILEKDTNFLRGMNVMDYSILMGVHYIDQDTSSEIKWATEARWKRLMKDSIGLLDIQADTDNFEDEKSCPFLRGSIPAKSENGDRLLLFIGIIDVLQTYRIIKIIENKVKSMTQSRDISVQDPNFYAQRLMQFLSKSVLKPLLTPEEREALSNKIAESEPRSIDDDDDSCPGCFNLSKHKIPRN